MFALTYLLAAFRERGIRTPQDIAVVGFDDIPPARFLDPPLTTVRQPLDDLGELSVQVLLRAIDGAEPTVHALAPTIVVRQSTR